MYLDSEDGCLPRKKIRIRFYPNQNSGFNLETKISSVEGRFKSSKKIDKNKLYIEERNNLIFQSGLHEPAEFEFWDEYQTLP